VKPATAKVKGRATESALVEHLRRHGWPHAERRRLTGRDDQGDIAGMRGPAGDVAVEVKSGARLDVAGWLAELERETTAARAATGFVAVRPKGKPDPTGWFAVMPLPWLLDLLAEAGYASIPT
jgi:Holliday junction resolvase